MLWDALVLLHDSTAVAHSPWAIVGDFNQIMRTSNHSGFPHIIIDESGVNDMIAAMQEAEVFEAQSKGSPFTWWNNQEDNPISKKLTTHLLIKLGGTLFWTLTRNTWNMINRTMRHACSEPLHTEVRYVSPSNFTTM